LIVGRARLAAERGLEAIRALQRRRRIAAARPAGRGTPHVFYGYDRVPGVGEYATGGIVKFQRLQDLFPNDPLRFNVMYVGSSSFPRDLRALLRLAERREAAIVWNQDGVGYPGWYGPRFERVNAPMIAAMAVADHVFFQSEFCRISAERYLVPAKGETEVLYNAVDTTFFTPGTARPDRPLTLVLGGSQYQRYRVEVAVETLATLRRQGHDVRLLVTGAIRWSRDPDTGARWALDLAARNDVADAFELVGRYRQSDAPELLRRGDILLHTKYNDPCPGTVIEAMSSGLPVVYSSSGGVPELVGEDAGIGVPAPLDWDADHPPNPKALADAVLRVADALDAYASAARQRAVARFDIEPWRARHVEVFEALAK